MVAQYIVDGLTHKEIGAQLYISPKTVEHHVAKIRQKLGASTRAEMLAALRSQLRVLRPGDPGQAPIPSLRARQYHAQASGLASSRYRCNVSATSSGTAGPHPLGSLLVSDRRHGAHAGASSDSSRCEPVSSGALVRWSVPSARLDRRAGAPEGMAHPPRRHPARAGRLPPGRPVGRRQPSTSRRPSSARPERELVGVLEVAAHRQAAGDAGDRQPERLEQAARGTWRWPRPRGWGWCRG